MRISCTDPYAVSACDHTSGKGVSHHPVLEVGRVSVEVKSGGLKGCNGEIERAG